MNDVDLMKMDQKDLEELHIKSLKIMELREQQIIDAIEAFDINALKAALVTNKDQILSARVWNEIRINMHQLNPQSIDMFLFIMSLPQFEVQNSKINSHTTLTEQAICKSFFDERLFDFFYNHKEFSSMLKSAAMTYAFVDTVPQEVIHKLFELKIFKPTKKIFNRVLAEDCFNFLEYFLNTELYNLTEMDYKEIYLNIWSEDVPVILKKIKEKLTNHNEIPLNTLITKHYVAKYGNDTQQKKYIIFVGLDTEIFARTLDSHKLTKNDVLKCVRAFDLRKNNIDDNFYYLIQLVAQNYPEYYSMVKNCAKEIKSETFRLLYNKAIDYFDLNMDLHKHEEKQKKLKL